MEDVWLWQIINAVEEAFGDGDLFLFLYATFPKFKADTQIKLPSPDPQKPFLRLSQKPPSSGLPKPFLLSHWIDYLEFS